MIAQKGDRVRIDYIGTLEDGTLFDMTKENEDVEFIIGANKVIRGLEDAVIGMKTGEQKKVIIQPEDAYGQVIQELIVRHVPKSEIHKNIRPAPGLMLQWDLPNNQSFTVKIIDVDEDTVSFDGNHLLAGKVLHFDITMLEVKKNVILDVDV